MSMSDSEDSLLEAEYAKVVDEVIEQLPMKKTACTTWPKINHHKRVGGKQVLVHPFLSDDNDMDKIVVRHLIVDEPYLSKHGDVSRAWSDCANNINADDESGKGERIFFPPISSKTLKTRFDTYMKYAYHCKASVPFHSGCDDEEEPCEIQAGIEEMHEKYIAFMDGKEHKKVSVVAKKMTKMQLKSFVVPLWE
jgi:hypothetical protein